MGIKSSTPCWLEWRFAIEMSMKKRVLSIGRRIRKCRLEGRTKEVQNQDVGCCRDGIQVKEAVIRGRPPCSFVESQHSQTNQLAMEGL